MLHYTHKIKVGNNCCLNIGHLNDVYVKAGNNTYVETGSDSFVASFGYSKVNVGHNCIVVPSAFNMIEIASGLVLCLSYGHSITIRHLTPKPLIVISKRDFFTNAIYHNGGQCLMDREIMLSYNGTVEPATLNDIEKYLHLNIDILDIIETDYKDFDTEIEAIIKGQSLENLK